MEIVIYLLLWAVIFYLYGKNRQLKTLLEGKELQAEKERQEREDQLNNFLDKFGGTR